MEESTDRFIWLWTDNHPRPKWWEETWSYFRRLQVKRIPLFCIRCRRNICPCWSDGPHTEIAYLIRDNTNDSINNLDIADYSSGMELDLPWQPRWQQTSKVSEDHFRKICLLKRRAKRGWEDCFRVRVRLDTSFKAKHYSIIQVNTTVTIKVTYLNA